MQIIDKYIPINSKEKVDGLVAELSSKSKKTITAYQEIFQKIQKMKIQTYFMNTYPKSSFTDIPSTESEEETESIDNPISLKVNHIAGQSKKEILQMPLPTSTLEDKKYIYGTYIEMAFHNFFLTISHIYSLVTGQNILRQAQAKLPPHKKNQNVDFGNENNVWKPMFDALH